MIIEAENIQLYYSNHSKCKKQNSENMTDNRFLVYFKIPEGQDNFSTGSVQ